MNTASEDSRTWWWRDTGLNRPWCGVFKGGGARGAAYAGALQAVYKEKQWFGAVAGSSAGAITAALVAAGYHPDEFRTITADLLKVVRPAKLVDRAVHSFRWTRPLTRYDSSSLEAALDEMLRKAVRRHGGDASKPVTFRTLDAAIRAPSDGEPTCGHSVDGGISLYVLALDASTGTPIPFCVETTPGLPVATAVAASCSIPIAFAPRYLEIDQDDVLGMTGWPWHMIVDGGAFANFPAFIFTDAAFRRHFNLNISDERPNILGFVLGEPKIVGQPRRFVDTNKGVRRLVDVKLRAAPEKADGNKPSNEARTNAAKDWLSRKLRQSLRLSVDFFRVGAEVASVAAVALLAWYGGSAVMSGNGFWKRLLGVAGCLLAVFLAVLLLALWRFASAATREGRATIQSIIGQATEAPIWVDALPGSAVIYVPSPGLGTTSFDAEPAVIGTAVDTAERACREQLEGFLRFGETPFVANRQQFTAAIPALRNMAQDLHNQFEKIVPTHVVPRSWEKKQGPR